MAINSRMNWKTKQEPSEKGIMARWIKIKAVIDHIQKLFLRRKNINRENFYNPL